MSEGRAFLRLGSAAEDHSVSLFRFAQGSGIVNDTWDLSLLVTVQDCYIIEKSPHDNPPIATLQRTGDLVTSDSLLIHLAKLVWFLSQRGQN